MISGSKCLRCRPRRHSKTARAIPLLASIVAAVAPVPHTTANVSGATSDITYLGSYTRDTDGLLYANLTRVRRTSLSGHKAPFILFDTDWDNGSAASRWAIVKTLDQFGKWSHIARGAAKEGVFKKGPAPGWAPFPTYNLTHAVFKSAYVQFTHRVLQKSKHSALTHLTASEQSLLNKILRLYYFDRTDTTINNDERKLPAVVVGGYAMHGNAW